MRTDIIKRRGYPEDFAGDELALSMSSYKQTARYLAQRVRPYGEVVCELCCGVGVSMIELTRVFRYVVGVDSNSAVLADCERNLRAAGAKNYTLIASDITTSSAFEDLQADVLLYDIPYWNHQRPEETPQLKNPDLRATVAAMRQFVTNNIVIYAPPAMTYTEVFGLLGPCEYNEVYINGKHDRNFIFLGRVAKKLGRTRTELFT
jgi:methylase of polypeptide subunit release factors